MLINYHSYKVKIRNTPFTTEDQKTFDNMAAISFYDENKKELQYQELGYIDTEDIYKLIDEGKDIDIDYCYVENFSLSTYRKSRGLKKDEYVTIKSFSAKEAIFDTHLKNDFSFGEFQESPMHFNNAVFLNGKISFNSCKFGNCGLDFSYVRTKNGNLDFSNTIFGNGELNFKNAILGNGVKNFQYAQFGEGKVTFTNAEFGDGDVAFINTDFNHGEVSFKIARFGTGNVDFRFAKFGEGNISFERTEFGHGKVNFSKVDFHDGKVNFNRAIFGNGDVSFEGCELKNGKLNFLSTEFYDGDLNFEYLEFDKSDIILDKAKFGNGKVSFYGSKIHILSIKSTILNNHIDLRVQKCSYVDLSGVVVRDLIDIKPHEFKVDIKYINFTGLCLLGRIYMDWKDNNVEELILNQKKTSYREKSEQFRILKQNFNANGNYDYEDNAYVLFKRFEEKAELQESLKSNPKGKIFHYTIFGLKWLLFDKMGKYATDPFRVLLSAFLTWFFFSLLHHIIPFFYNNIHCYNYPNQPISELERLGTTFYYSSITFFTVGYGDIYPLIGAGKIVAGIEPFFGTFMMAYFTVAFARKILR
ncbi:MAG: two pore domain potassium channel family protein [Bacteroidia bacterium]|nr:two pore domain potassium channel family protein [Bacteroidia bacterium]